MSFTVKIEKICGWQSFAFLVSGMWGGVLFRCLLNTGLTVVAKGKPENIQACVGFKPLTSLIFQLPTNY